MDRYITFGEPEVITNNGMQCTIQRYQGDHRNEFLLRFPNGDVILYENNVRKQQWKESESGKKLEEFVRYKNGRVDFRERFQDIIEESNFNRIYNNKKGLRMEIWSTKTDHLLYHGEFNEKRQKEGWGIEYDEESGNMLIEGIWSKGSLIEVIRCFNGDVMTELKKNGPESVDPAKRIPIYVGGFRYDEDNETFVREGNGCLIDEKTGIATRESEWKDGKEVSGVDLNGGYFDSVTKSKSVTSSALLPSFPELKKKPSSSVLTFPPLKVNIKQESALEKLSQGVTDLVIASNSCNTVKILDLSKYTNLLSVEIGDDCFGSVKKFRIDKLNNLRSLKIGRNSFTRLKSTNAFSEEISANTSFSFHITNCEALESVEIREYSFFDFSGEFELMNLPSLQSIKLGAVCSISNNFYCSSCIIRCIIDSVF